MFRASDIFGRRPGSVPDKPKVEPKPQDEPKARTWDPATGQFVEEELPAEVQEMMRAKRPKVAEGPLLPPPPPPPAPRMPPVAAAVERPSPKRLRVALSGFLMKDLNGQYTERPDQPIQGQASVWNSSMTYFIYWQRSMERWAICDSGSVQSARDGQVPGWAYRSDSQHFANSKGWMEVSGNAWSPAIHVVCTVIEGSPPDMAKEEPSAPGRPQLSVAQYRALVRRVYEEKNPSKLQDLATIFDKYQGREQELLTQVCDKYEASLEALMGGANGAPSPANSSASCERAEGKDQDGEMPELSAREFAILVQGVYQKHNPAKLADLARLLQKFRGIEREFYLQVCDKYGVQPVKFYKEEGARILSESDL
ncbi:unnamed protein product [Effrenium voratum]|uniref:Uncharacterized protein n=1 Tax=Effrenium voratum TaxID=2562239 RepID=A0AA36MXV9_9DINO|nr:unnamed protein product [Effrenium voratum]